MGAIKPIGRGELALADCWISCRSSLKGKHGELNHKNCGDLPYDRSMIRSPSRSIDLPLKNSYMDLIGCISRVNINWGWDVEMNMIGCHIQLLDMIRWLHQLRLSSNTFLCFGRTWLCEDMLCTPPKAVDIGIQLSQLLRSSQSGPETKE